MISSLVFVKHAKACFRNKCVRKSLSRRKKIIIKRSYVRLDVTFAFGGIQLGDGVEW
jgi:hypothetical protein